MPANPTSVQEATANILSAIGHTPRCECDLCTQLASDIPALVAAVRRERDAEIRKGVWDNDHLGSCPASTNLPDDGPEDVMWCDCGLERFDALATPDTP